MFHSHKFLERWWLAQRMCWPNAWCYGGQFHTQIIKNINLQLAWHGHTHAIAFICTSSETSWAESILHGGLWGWIHHPSGGGSEKCGEDAWGRRSRVGKGHVLGVSIEGNSGSGHGEEKWGWIWQLCRSEPIPVACLTVLALSQGRGKTEDMRTVSKRENCAVRIKQPLLLCHFEQIDGKATSGAWWPVLYAPRDIWWWVNVRFTKLD